MIARFDRSSFIATVNVYAQCSVLRDQEVIHFNVRADQPERTNFNAVVALYMNDEPFIVIGGMVKVLALAFGTLSHLIYSSR